MAFNDVIYLTSGESLKRSWKLADSTNIGIDITNIAGNVKVINTDISEVISATIANGYLFKDIPNSTFLLNLPGNLLSIPSNKYVLQFSIINGNDIKAIEDSLLVINWG